MIANQSFPNSVYQYLIVAMPHFDDLSTLQCPACAKWFKTTKGRNTHLVQARDCKWYRLGKMRELVDDLQTLDLDASTSILDSGKTPILAESTLNHSTEPQDDLNYDWNPNWDNDQPYPSDTGYNSNSHDPSVAVDRDEYLLLPQQGPGPQTRANRAARIAPASRALDDEDDSRYIIEHPTAGRVIRKEVDSDGDITMEDESEQFAPFKSEMDWKVAEWAIQDSIGKNSFNRFLSISGVRHSLYIHSFC